MKEKKFVFFGALALLLIIGVLFFQMGGYGTAFLWNVSQQGQWLLPLIIVSALLDSINPCAFSVLLLTIAFLFSVGKLRSNILKIGTLYILGIFTVYILIGLGILQTLHLFNTPHFMAKVGAWLLIVLGIVNVINELFPRFPLKLKIPEKAHHAMAQLIHKASLPTAFGLGILVGLCEFPCTGGPYLMVLGLLHDQATYLKGAMHLILYNVIFVLPLVIILAFASDKRLIERVQDWQKEKRVMMRFWGGFAMILLGLFILLV